MGMMRHALDIWLVGFGVAWRTLGPIFLFVTTAMFIAGALYKMGGGVALSLICWMGGVYMASMPFVSASVCLASRGAQRGFVAAAGGSGRFSLIFLWLLLIAVAGGALGIFGLGLALQARSAEALAQIGPAPVAASAVLGWAIAAYLFGRSAVRLALVETEDRRDEAPRPGPLRLPFALLIGPAPLAAGALWLDMERPSAVAAGGYWTLEHAAGEAGVFALAGLALCLLGVALTDSTPPQPSPKPS